jgi:hypothetical protein
MRSHRNQNRLSVRLEELETRDAPATLVNANTVTYQDVDGDKVIVTLSKPLLTTANVNNLFVFDAGTVDGGNTTKQQLEELNLGVLGQPANGLAVTMSAVRSMVNGGDGFAALGHVAANGIDLGFVVVDGDLGRIVAGDGVAATTGVTSLKTHSMGRYSTSTGAADLESTIAGKLGSLVVKSDIRNAYVKAGSFGAVTIGGSLIGGAAPNSGRLSSSGNIGQIKIGGDIVGGNGNDSGSIVAQGALANVTLGGSLRGGGGTVSGRIHAVSGSIGVVTIKGDQQGSSGFESGAIMSGDRIMGAAIGGSLRGGAGIQSGRIYSIGAIGPVRIVGDLIGGSAAGTGLIHTAGALVSATIGGSVVGEAAFSGRISSDGSMGAVKVKGDITGANAQGTGVIESNATITSVTIGGSLRGGTQANSGFIQSQGAMGAVKIAGDILGGSLLVSGAVISNGDLASVTIGGSVRGGAGDLSGMIRADRLIALKITGDLIGGSASGADDLMLSGHIAANRIASLTIGGSLIAGVDNTTGTFQNNGSIFVGHDIGSALIKGNIIGNVTNSAVISARGSATPTATSDITIASLTVRGRVEFAQILAGVDEGNAKNADAQIGAVRVGGNWFASSIAAGALPGVNGYGSGDSKLAGAGVKDEPTLSSRISSITIGGQVLGTVGGSTHFGFVAENVGAVKVGGTLLPLTAGNSNDDFLVGITGDFRVNEI